MDNPTRKAFNLTLTDGEGRETKEPSSFVSLGSICEKITRTVERTRVRNDNLPGWGAAKIAQPGKKEGS